MPILAAMQPGVAQMRLRLWYAADALCSTCQNSAVWSPCGRRGLSSRLIR